MKPTDYHTHTPLCRHAEGSVREYVQAALQQGLAEYGVADHAPMPNEPFDDWRMLSSELPAYFDWIAEAECLARDTDLQIRCGLECDWVPGIESWIDHLHALRDWDYLIGSVHYLDNKWDFDNPLSMVFWNQTSVEEAWRRYWNLYLDMVRSRQFTIMGHADLIRKFGHRPSGDLKRYYIPVIEAMADAGSVLEINTAGWSKPCAEQYPSREFLSLACEAGIPLVINSDAHAPQDIGKDFERALTLAKETGFSHLARIKRGRIVLMPIDDTGSQDEPEQA
ncbi:histidinol-phosphatase [Akkermansia sp. N21116]|uniref:histidinol-phosphatase n=1 Tax=Akkermansia sp. N21116 TaxID=3040764 RepID=UPI00244E8135|nr:histidinol-phosphatase [Akkermansia sp. N21116]WPX40625.1 histidinol-phosphatase [Akkermansia sp. N21116]